MVRHDLFAGAISPAPRGVFEAAAPAALIAPRGLPTPHPAGVDAATSGAVDLAPVATTANQDLLAAEDAEEEAAAAAVVEIATAPEATFNPWTRSASGAIMPLQSCSGTVWGAAPRSLPSSVGAAPGPMIDSDCSVSGAALSALERRPKTLRQTPRMQTRIAHLTHVGTLAFGRKHAAVFELMRADQARPMPNLLELVRLGRQHELTMYRAFGVFFEGRAASQSGAPADGIQDMRRGVGLLREQNVLMHDGLLKIALAEAEARAGDLARAIAVLDEALETCNRLVYRAFEAELHRARGEILLKRDPANAAPAEDAFLTPIAVAKRQATRSFQLRAALALAKLYQSINRPAEAHAILAPALEGFSPTPEMPEIAEAQALLEALAETDEVKAATTTRHKRVDLQIALGNALIAARGYGAAETQASFERARAP